ncbi:MAG: ribonuclease III [Ignavibacteriales bacterium]|nr:MAG: ribonuclease III [Ignavibacteriales bacterium]
MAGFFSWLLKIIKQREETIRSKNISRFLTSQKFDDLEKSAGIIVKDKSFYIQALMHRSYLEQSSEYLVSNERLEFLGDSVLNLAVAEYLFKSFPEQNEGFLTKVRAKLVNRVALADAADGINLSRFLLISKNLSTTFSNGSKTILADAFEALIGAIYLDGGLDAAKEFVNRTLIIPNSKAGDHLIDENFKSQLLEYAQANRLDNPTYIVVKEEGPQHDRIFTIKVIIGDTEYGTGQGKNKKSAEQNAAQRALKKINQQLS